MKRLSEKEILEKIQPLEGWTLNKNALERNFELSNFKEALALVNQIGELVEENNHHPELHNIYNKLTVRFWTHDVDGITDLDVQLATKINGLP